MLLVAGKGGADLLPLAWMTINNSMPSLVILLLYCCARCYREGECIYCTGRGTFSPVTRSWRGAPFWTFQRSPDDFSLVRGVPCPAGRHVDFFV